MKITTGEVVELYINSSELLKKECIEHKLFFRISNFCKSILLHSLQYPNSLGPQIEEEYRQLLLLAKQLNSEPWIKVTGYSEVEIDAAAELVANFGNEISQEKHLQFLSMQRLFDQS